MEWLPAYAVLGAVVGFFAGLLGIGGGLMLVPALTFIFSAQNFHPDHILHLALGTTMAAIIFSSAASLHTHHRHNAVNWEVVKYITPGIVIGTSIGSSLASLLSTRLLSVIFVAFIYFAATQMLLKISPKATRTLPGTLGMLGVGGTIGFISSFVAIGGGILTVPFLSFCNVPLQRAIGTAAAVGFPIAVAGAIGYMVNGMARSPDLPEYSLGFVYLPALLGVVAGSMITAPIGARTTHVIRTDTLRKIFVILLYILGTKMLIGLF